MTDAYYQMIMFGLIFIIIVLLFVMLAYNNKVDHCINLLDKEKQKTKIFVDRCDELNYKLHTCTIKTIDLTQELEKLKCPTWIDKLKRKK